MRASDLLASRVVDATGRDLGPVRDVRLREEGGVMRATAVVVGGGRFAGLAHALGVAEGRVQGPWPLVRLCRDAIACARVIPAEHVVDWGPGTLRADVAADGLRPLSEERP